MVETTSNAINLEYDQGLRSFVVSMPEHVTLAAIEDLQERLFAALASQRSQSNLLIDSNRHDFESTACLKALREMLEAPQVVSKCMRVAFVQPKQYRETHVASDQEGYFQSIEAARAWIRNCMQT
jgi:hypothetical protein